MAFEILKTLSTVDRPIRNLQFEIFATAFNGKALLWIHKTSGRIKDSLMQLLAAFEDIPAKIMPTAGEIANSNCRF